MSELLTFNSLAAFATLAVLEIVLGLDNLVFLAILSAKMPAPWRPLARQAGLALAAIGRIALVFAIAWLVTLDTIKLFHAFGEAISIKDLVMLAGGVFLVGKATWEIHDSLEGASAHHPGETSGGGGGPAEAEADRSPTGSVRMGLFMVLMQIVALDLVFSIDSVLTAVGMVKPDDYHSAHLPFTPIPWVPFVIMAGAILAAIGVMLFFVGPLSRLIERHPTIKMLALAFLVLIGVVLVAEGCHQHIPRGYIYFAMAFSIGVELLNLRMGRGRKQKSGISSQESESAARHTPEDSDH